MNKQLGIFPLKLFFDKSKFSNEDGDCVGGREIDGKSGWWRKRDRRKDLVKWKKMKNDERKMKK
jgi:hypothetical protein